MGKFNNRGVLTSFLVIQVKILLPFEEKLGSELNLGCGPCHAGLGFASVLRDFGLPSDALALALVAFNVGVEIGQLVIVAIAVGLLLLLDKTLAEPGVAPTRRPALVFTVSAVIAIMGFYWLGQRTVFA